MYQRGKFTSLMLAGTFLFVIHLGKMFNRAIIDYFLNFKLALTLEFSPGKTVLSLFIHSHKI